MIRSALAGCLAVALLLPTAVFAQTQTLDPSEASSACHIYIPYSTATIQIGYGSDPSDTHQVCDALSLLGDPPALVAYGAEGEQDPPGRPRCAKLIGSPSQTASGLLIIWSVDPADAQPWCSRFDAPLLSRANGED